MAITSIKTGSSFTNLVKYNDFLAGNPAFSPSSYESIATVTATGGETELNFISIPATYKHLQIRGISQLSGANWLALQLNTDSGANYTYHYLQGNGTAASAAGSTGESQITFISRSPATASIFGTMILDIIDYASTSKYKTIRSFTGADTNGAGNILLTSGLWLSTLAVTGLTIKANSGTYAAGTTFALYGIKG